MEISLYNLALLDWTEWAELFSLVMTTTGLLLILDWVLKELWSETF